MTAAQSQLDKFKETARDLECDEDEDAFKAKLRKIATAPKPAPEKPS
ncbi:hypothetical protein SPAN111604_14770 [Sphingomonas antarctica]